MMYERLSMIEVVLYTPILHKDNREYFCAFLEFNMHFCQDNISYSQKNVIRGLHTNTLHFAQSKLISVLKESIFDVAVDFRVGSPTFKKYVAVELNSQTNQQLFIPREFLHGFSVLSEEAFVMIKVDRYFQQGESIGVADQELKIDWRGVDPILSPADLLLPPLHSLSISPF